MYYPESTPKDIEIITQFIKSIPEEERISYDVVQVLSFLLFNRRANFDYMFLFHRHWGSTNYFGNENTTQEDFIKEYRLCPTYDNKIPYFQNLRRFWYFFPQQDTEIITERNSSILLNELTGICETKTPYVNRNFLINFEYADVDNFFRIFLDRSFGIMGGFHKLEFLFNNNQSFPTFDFFSKNIAGDFLKTFISYIENLFNPYNNSIYFKDIFVEPEKRFIIINNEIKLYFDFSYEISEEYDIKEEYFNMYDKSEYIQKYGNDRLNRTIEPDKYFSKQPCFQPHITWKNYDFRILRKKYIINNAKMTDFSKNEVKNYLSSYGFPYGNSYKEYIRFLRSMNYSFSFCHETIKEKYACSFYDLFKIFLPSKIKSNDFMSHTHIIGRSGSGKSELLKTIIKEVKERCILIDPHGDIADSLDKKKNFFKLAPHENRFVINPFDISDKTIGNRELVTEEIVQLLEEIIQDTNVSILMKTISFPIISTLLKLPYADFRMFADCINPITGIEHLEKLTPLVDSHLKKLWEDLKTDAYDTTKRSIFNRLQSFLNKYKIITSVCGYDDFDETIKRVEQGENLVISLPIPQLGEEVCEVLGRFIMCRLQIWAKRRQNLPPNQRTPILLIVDECQNFLSQETANTLDQFGRKFGLYMVLAHQHIAQIDGKGLKGSILANCKNKIVGYCDDGTIATMSKAIGVPSDDFKTLKKGHFYALFEEKEPFKFYARLAHFRNNSDEQIIYAPSSNTDFLDGWDLVEEYLHDNHKNKAKSSKFTPKFDL